MTCGSRAEVFSSSARANSCLSVSERKNVSPNAVAQASTLLSDSSVGRFKVILEFSTAALNLTHVIEFVLISSSTSGTVTCSSFTENGSSPARKAEVSKTSIFRGVFFWIFHPMPLNSSLLLSRS